jgi:predicted DNA-binding protein
MAQTVRITQETHKTLRRLSEKAGESMQTTLDKAIEAYRRHQVLTEANEAYARLRANPRAWKKELAERKAWEATIADGLEK